MRQEATLKKAEEVMEILEAYDLTGSLRAAAALCGCDHKTVALWVTRRDEGAGTPGPAPRPRPATGDYGDKVAELVDRSHGKIRADRAHATLVAMGYNGSERSTRRAVAESKRRFRQKHGRRTRPWIAEPGLWMQFDYAHGPEVQGRPTSLFCAWLAWSRFRVVIPLIDRTLPSVVMALDRTLRRIGAAPTYVLTDNERTVTTDHVCGIAVRNPQIVAASRHYGLTIATCVPADPQSKGGSEATVRIAKADLVPTDHNLRPSYSDFAELEAACESFCQEVNTRPHRSTRKAPALMLADERSHLHKLPALCHTLCFGQTRRVSWQSTVSVGGAIYSVPSTLVDRRVWVRTEGSELVVVDIDDHKGPSEVARHALGSPGHPSLNDSHYPPRPAGALDRRPRGRDADERAFLAIGDGDGAEAWLVEAASRGTSRIRRKMAEAVDLAKLHGSGEVGHALKVCAKAGRFGEGDLASILAHQQSASTLATSCASETHTLQRSTGAWTGFGR
jgi:transposase